MSYKNISEIRRSIPRYIQKTKPDIRVKKKVLFVCAAISFLAAVWKINGTEKNPLMLPEELELSEAGEAAGEDKKGEDTEVMMSDERELRIELAILYDILELLFRHLDMILRNFLSSLLHSAGIGFAIARTYCIVFPRP